MKLKSGDENRPRRMNLLFHKCLNEQNCKSQTPQFESHRFDTGVNLFLLKAIWF